MAIAGGATSAYDVWLSSRGGINQRARTISRDLCVSVADAVPLLRAGQTVTVAGNDMWALRTALEEGKGESNGKPE